MSKHKYAYVLALGFPDNPEFQKQIVEALATIAGFREDRHSISVYRLDMLEGDVDRFACEYRPQELEHYWKFLLDTLELVHENEQRSINI
jgi:hypothetical protein